MLSHIYLHMVLPLAMTAHGDSGFV